MSSPKKAHAPVPKGTLDKKVQKQRKRAPKAPEKLFWVQCDTCQKWRIVSKAVSAEVKASPDQLWTCSKAGSATARVTCDTIGDDARFGENGSGMPAGYLAS
jgi:hypothetical protein